MTLSGQGRRRILYLDTCDPAQVWTTSHCQDQAAPQLVVQNLTFADGNSTGQRFDGGGGGAIFDRGGRLVNSHFAGDSCNGGALSTIGVSWTELQRRPREQLRGVRQGLLRRTRHHPLALRPSER